MAFNILPLLQGAKLGSPDTLATLLKGAQATPVTPIAPQEVPEEAPIVVESPEQSKLKDGVAGGFFRGGSTGGNILGLLGDAFLVQSGNAPRYAPRLQQARESEALKGLADFPEEALARYAQVNPQGALPVWDKMQDNARQREVLDLQRQRQREESEGIVHQRAAAWAGAATQKTWPAIRKRILADYAAKGVEPPIDLPEDWDEAVATTMRLGGVAPKDQVRENNLMSYRQQQLENQRKVAEDRAAYYNQNAAERARHNREQERLGAQNAEARTITAKASDKRADKYQPGGGKPKGGTPKLLYDPKTGKVALQ